MKKKLYIHKLLLILLVLPILINSCNKQLDINIDPNSPAEVTENLLLTGVLANFSYEVIAGEPNRYTVTWTKQLASASSPIHSGNYQLNGGDVNNLWTYYSYTDVMSNAKLLIKKATENGNPNYSAIGKVILAWNLSIVTDLFGDVPYSEAFQGEQKFFKAKYDSQEDIYKSIQSLLDEAITEAANTNNREAPGTDDIVYGGQMDRWIALAHTLKARFHLRLSYAPGHTAANQAALALSELDKGAITASNQPMVNYQNSKGAENPWYQYAIDGKWAITTRPSQFYLDTLKAIKDPRIGFQADTVAKALNVDSLNVGKYFGVTNEPPANSIANYSPIGSFYSAADAPLYWLIYPEVEFIRAEAEFLKANKTVTADVIKAYKTAIKSSMDFYGITEAENDTYQAGNVLSTNPDVAYAQIMMQKYIANFMMFESYNDYRRTGYPILPINNEKYTDQTSLDQPPRMSQIPVRFPYPSSERLYNSKNIPSNIPTDPLKAMLIPVWWNSN